MELPRGKTARIEITLNNSVGVSPKATLFIPRSDNGMLKTAVALSLKAVNVTFNPSFVLYSVVPLF